MVRLEIILLTSKLKAFFIFTFQYGQIRNSTCPTGLCKGEEIYIPVWLDQKFLREELIKEKRSDLHSSMVRLEIIFIRINNTVEIKFTFQYGQIRNVHVLLDYVKVKKFTFQYGQIRNFAVMFLSLVFIFIYIPVWLDQKYDLKELLKINVRRFTFQYGQIRNSY